MMRLLFLCLLLLPGATAVSEETEGSADDDTDDEDLVKKIQPKLATNVHGSTDKTTGQQDTSDQFTLIFIVVAAVVLTLSVAVIVTIMLVRRRMHSRQQGVYSVPTEQDQKGAV